MPLRNPDVFTSILGVLVVAVLVGFRVDFRGAARNGPRWLRRFVVAGMAVLGMFSGSTPVMAEQNPYVVQEVANTSDIEAFPEGKELMKLWAEAEEIAAGKKGNFPFDRAGKDRFLKNLTEAEALIDTLVTKKCFREPEGGLLKVDLRGLAEEVGKKRPKEMVDATCYKPMMLYPAIDALERLELRLPLLEKLEAGKLSPSVEKKLRSAIKQDIDYFKQDRPHGVYLNAETTVRFEKMLKQIPNILEKLDGKGGQ